MKRNLLIGATFVIAIFGLVVAERALEQTAAAQAKSGQVPIFEVDPFWPKAMPNNWVFGQTIGLGIDEKDQVWIIHRGNDPSNLDGTEYATPPPRTGHCGISAVPGAPARAARSRTAAQVSLETTGFMKNEPTLLALGSAGSITIDLRRRISITASRTWATDGAAMPRSARWRCTSG